MVDSFDEKLARLAELLVWAGGVHAGSRVLLLLHNGCETLANKVAVACYEQGAAHVTLQYVSQPAIRAKLAYGDPEYQTFFSDAEKRAWQEMYEEGGRIISIRADYDPVLFEGMSEELGSWIAALKKSWGDAFSKGVAEGELAWTLFYQPQAELAKQVFPDATEAEAIALYWEELFAVTGADRKDCLEYVKANNAALKRRQDKLNRLGIKSVHFSSPCGTNFTVGLSQQARWVGGAKQARLFDRPMHTANVPTYEVFTTPDWRTVEGVMHATRPIMVDGVLLEDIVLTFKDGEVINVDAKDNVDTLLNLVKRDEGACRLGELALVGVDSPVFQRGHFFRTIILDENAACHVAVGSAYGTCIDGFADMTPEQLVSIGYNGESVVHTDIMISDEQTTVVATTYDGEEVPLLIGGGWTESFQ